MKKLLTCLSLILTLILATVGCGISEIVTDEAVAIVQQEVTDIADISDIDEDEDSEEELPEEEFLEEELLDEGFVEEEFVEEEFLEEELLEEDGSYISPEDVALYIHTYGKLPENFITKKEAMDLGWVSKEGNLDEVAPGMSIGGDRFGNYEQVLPDGNYKECDVNYTGGYRGDERLVYSADGEIYYTDDHYATFTQLY